MNGIVITHPGMETIAQQEVHELISRAGAIAPSVCTFPIAAYDELAILAYRGHSFIKVLFFLDALPAGEHLLEELRERIPGYPLAPFFSSPESTFRVHCTRIGNERFSSAEIMDAAGSVIHHPVDLDNPNVILYIYVFKEQAYVGVDIAGFDLSKRDYKIFHTPSSIKGTLAFAAVRSAPQPTTLLDPLCGSGEIAIEAALYFSRVSPHFFRKDAFLFTRLPLFSSFSFAAIDALQRACPVAITACDSQFRFLHATQKNAQIANIKDAITFSRSDIEWLDTKFTPQSMGMMVSRIPASAPKRLLAELFYQAAYILASQGNVALLTTAPAAVHDAASRHPFRCVAEQHIWQGKEQFTLLLFHRKA
ncbi:hypothetical protein HY491_03280 [Candidatus Woesearchaeota archaeon]|nr:hypothetical protein [Candidatus Woesearchaeota archaeon]